ncbi:MAG: SIS domain-containing protein [Planctomycetes bacterium]|nr:SIS domain-containing protein [Planctomycetota bacterium]
MANNHTTQLRARISEAQTTFAALDEHFIESVSDAAACAIESLKKGGAIFFIGNGGSAADAQHWAAELVGRYLCERQPLNAHALTTNSSTYTALVNDYPAEEVFERQVIAHVRANDIVFAISTSGNSENILRAVSAAQKIGAQVVGVTGKDGGQLSNHCDICFIAPSNDTPRIQEAHLFFGHNLCEIIERAFVAE